MKQLLTIQWHATEYQDKVSKNVASHYFARETKVRDIGVEQMLKKIYTAAFNDNGTSRAAENITKMSIEDRQFLDLMERECSKEGNHYKLPLPLINPDAVFPNNRRMAELRLKNLKKRFIKDKQYHKDCTSFMKDMIRKGYAEMSDSKTNQQGKTWFIPHHGIYYPSKPGKVWIVFDCSEEYDGVSVNKRLLSGPDLTNQIVGILVKFREDYVAIMADIEAMFYQVFVANQHRSLLSFLWWENGATTKVSSPSCSNYALRRTARDNEAKYDPEVAEILRRNFYVDDILKSVKDEETAVTLIKDVKALCAEGGFHLTRFVRNS